jgi:hypothetical protein
MKAFPKVGLLVVVALLATAALATSARAVTINPDNTAMSGLSTDSSWTYGVQFWTCERATMDGNTGLDSDRIPDLALTFTQNCAVAGVGPVTVDCVGDVSLIADPAADDTGTWELNDGFSCTVTTATCTINVSGPQQTQPKNTSLDEAADVLHVNLTMNATREGNVMCGPSSGAIRLTANYATTPSNLTIDPGNDP